MQLLPSFAPLLRKSLQMESSWRTAMQETRNLYDLLAVDPKVTKDASKAGPEVVAVETVSSSLTQHLAELRAFAKELRLQLIRQSSDAEPQGTVCTGIDALLETALPAADERVELWTAGRDLGRRLLEESLANTLQPGDESAEAQDDENASSTGTANEEARRSARWSIDLLQLGGLETEELENELRKASGTEAATAYPIDLGFRLYSAWSKELPAALESRLKNDANLIAADRLSRIVPPLDQYDGLADPGTNPSRRLRARRLNELWTWLAGLYDAESRDLGSSNLLLEAAMGCRDLATPVPLPLVQFSGIPGVVELSGEHPSARVDLSYRVVGPRPVQPKIEPFGIATRWLKVALSSPPQASAEDTKTASFLVELTPQALNSREPPPRGFLARARVDESTFHARVNLSVETSADKLRTILSSEPRMPAAGLKTLRVRPTKGLQPFYVFVMNPAPKTRKVKVFVKAGDVQLPGGTAELMLNAESSVQVNFGGGGVTPAPASPTNPNPASTTVMVELAGPLTITLIDVDTGKSVSQTAVDVGLASPGEYVRLVNARFEPPSAVNKGKNRFIASLVSLGGTGGPAIHTELVLPASRIPGLRGVSEGELRSEIDPKTGSATLMARDIQLDSISDERGRVYINVDDYKRAYVLDTTFARHGDPTTPQIDFTPDLRIVSRPVALSGSTYEVRLEVDNAPADATLQISLGRIELAGFVADRIFAARPPRNRRLTVGVVQGTIALEGALADWSIPIDLTGLSGGLALRAVLQDKDGREIKKVTQRVIVDGAAPRDVRIVDLPAQGRRGSQIQVRAVGKPSESGIKEVSFFWGKPVEGKLPPNAETAPAAPANSSKTTWTAKLKLPEDKKGPTSLSVQFISAAGAEAFDSRTIELLDTEPSQVGRLRVKVLEGDRPQSGLDVIVQDAKGTIKQQGTTGPDGVYLTGMLEKGNYLVRSAKPATPSLGQSKAAVEPGRTKLVTVDLFYKRLR